MRPLAWIAAVLFVAITCVIAYEVIARYLFDAPTIWAHEVSVLLAATAFVIGGPVVHAERRHIVISIAYERFPPRLRRYAAVLNALLSVVFLAILSFAAWQQAVESIALFETSGTALNWPIPMLLKTFLAGGASIMALQSLVQLTSDALVLEAPET